MVVLVLTAANCTTVYDAYGRPHEMVDPAAAVVGAAAVGLLAYGLGNSSRHQHYSHGSHYYAPPAYNCRPSYRSHAHFYRDSCDY